MTEIFELFGFPPHPVAGICLLVLALLWSLRARRKLRPSLLALQVAIIGNILGAVLVYGRGDSDDNLIASIANITVGQIIMFWFIAWLVISLVFLIRARNDSANIFTRNRKS